MLIEEELSIDSLIKSKADIDRYGMTMINDDSANSEVHFYMMRPNSLLEEIQIRMHLVAYNNRIKRHYDFNENFDVTPRASIFLLGSIIDHFLGQYIFDDGIPKVDKSDFYNLP